MNPKIAFLVALLGINMVVGLGGCSPEKPQISTKSLEDAFVEAVPPVQETVARASTMIAKNELPGALAALEPLRAQPLNQAQKDEIQKVIDEIYKNMKEVK